MRWRLPPPLAVAVACLLAFGKARMCLLAFGKARLCAIA
jgi:hypothetical protein